MQARLTGITGITLFYTGDVAHRGQRIMRFGRLDDAVQFLRSFQRDDGAMASLREIAIREFAAPAGRPGWDSSLLLVLAQQLVSGRLKVAMDFPEENLPIGRVPLRPREVDELLAPEPYVMARPAEDEKTPSPRDPTHWIEIELLGEDDAPIPGVAYEITLPDKSLRRGRLDRDGFARIDGLPEGGDCMVCFPELDKDAWEKIDTQPAR